jgi:hypothetical protein
MEHTHFTKCFSDNDLVLRTGDRLSVSYVKRKIREAAQMDEEEYSLFL